MRIVRSLTGGVLCLALAACESAVAPSGGGELEADLARLGPLLESVTGSAKFHRVAMGEEYWHSASFTMRRYADGSVDGTYQALGRTGSYHGRVVCFTVVDTRAWVGVVVERSKEGPPFPGDPRILYMEDNGEGAGDAPDRSTAFPPLGITGLPTLEDYCAETPEIRERSVYDLEAGNVQIRR